MISTNDLKNGVAIEVDGNLFQIVEFQHVLQNKVAYVRVKMKNLRTGSVTETTLNAGVKVKKAFLDRKEMQYLYSTGEAMCFMDTTTYEQIEIPEARLDWERKFMVEGSMVNITFYQNEILGVDLPDKVALTITECTEPVKGAATERKKAVLETGYELNVPVFLAQGEKILVSTLDGSYVSRA